MSFHERDFGKVTLQECVDAHKKGTVFFINDGRISGCIQEEIPTQTANPSGDNK